MKSTNKGMLLDALERIERGDTVRISEDMARECLLNNTSVVVRNAGIRYLTLRHIGLNVYEVKAASNSQISSTQLV